MDLPKRAAKLWWLAIAAGMLGAVAGMLWVNSPDGPGFEWIWLVAALGVGVIVYNAAFFALCSIFVPGLSNLVEDDTEVKGDDVTHVVRHIETGDEGTDFYIRAYAGARAISATTIVAAIMITGALWFF